jgi:WD40 repeat protein
MIRKAHQLTGHNAAIYALADGLLPGTFLSAAGDGWLVAWDIDNPDVGKLVAKTDTQIFSLATLADVQTLVAGDMNGGIHWLHPDDDRPNRHIAHHRKGVYGLLRQGDLLFSIGGDGVVTAWDIHTERSIESLQISNQALRAIQPHPTLPQLIIGSSDNGIYCLDAATFTLAAHLPDAHDNSVFALLPHPTDRDMLFSGGRDALLKVWDISLNGAWLPVGAQPAHWFTINDIIASPDGRHLLTASRDKTIRIWDAADFSLLRTLDAVRDGGHINSVNRLYWIPDTPYFASASDDRAVIVWEWL